MTQDENPTKLHQVYEVMKDILSECPDGLRAVKLAKRIEEKHDKDKLPDVFDSYFSDVEKNYSDINKQKIKGKGTFYFLVQNDDTSEESDNTATPEKDKYSEEDFYASFAEYLQYGNEKDNEYNYLDECTQAIPKGGSSKLHGKWGMPDVIGVLKPGDNDNVKFLDEIVSAEIKSERSNDALITGFGQACAYRLFSHKTYLAVPKPKDMRHTNRIEKLCQMFGIGLVYFDPTQKPDVSIYNLKLPAQKHSPDMSYVNSIVDDDVANALKLNDRNTGN